MRRSTFIMHESPPPSCRRARVLRHAAAVVLALIAPVIGTASASPVAPAPTGQTTKSSGANAPVKSPPLLTAQDLSQVRRYVKLRPEQEEAVEDRFRVLQEELQTLRKKTQAGMAALSPSRVDPNAGGASEQYEAARIAYVDKLRKLQSDMADALEGVTDDSEARVVRASFTERIRTLQADFQRQLADFEPEKNARAAMADTLAARMALLEREVEERRALQAAMSRDVVAQLDVEQRAAWNDFLRAVRRKKLSQGLIGGEGVDLIAFIERLRAENDSITGIAEPSIDRVLRQWSIDIDPLLSERERIAGMRQRAGAAINRDANEINELSDAIVTLRVGLRDRTLRAAEEIARDLASPDAETFRQRFDEIAFRGIAVPTMLQRRLEKLVDDETLDAATRTEVRTLADTYLGDRRAHVRRVVEYAIRWQPDVLRQRNRAEPAHVAIDDMNAMRKAWTERERVYALGLAEILKD